MDIKRSLDVVVAAPNQDLVSLSDARDEVGAPGRQNDARLKRYITGASAAVATYTRRVWRQETVTEAFYLGYSGTGWGWGWYGSSGGWGWPYRHHPDGSQVPLVLARFPVASIASVTVDGTVVDPTTYFLDATKGLLYRDWQAPDIEGSWDWGWGSKTIVDYTGGYDAISDVPPDVQEACMAAIRQRYFSHGRDPYLRSINVPGVQEESYWAGPDQSALPPEACGLLEKHIDMRM